MRKQIQTLNEAVGYNYGDLFLVKKDRNLDFDAKIGDIIVIIRVPSQGMSKYYRIAIVPQKEDLTKLTDAKINKIANTSNGRSDLSFPPYFLEFVENGDLKPLTLVDKGDLEDVVTNVGLVKVLKVPMSKIVLYNNRFFYIDLGTDPEIQTTYYPQIVTALKRRGIETSDLSDNLSAVDLTRNIVIPQAQ